MDKTFEQSFYEDDSPVSNNHIKKCSTSLVIRKRKKTTVRCHYTPVRMARV